MSHKFQLLPAILLAFGLSAHAAQLSTDARAAVPRDVRQLIVIDYREMQNSDTAMQLRDRVMPPNLKEFDDALRKSGLNDNHDVDQLAFALFHPASGGTDDVTTLGIAQGNFPTDDILARFKKNHVKPALVRANKIYPMGKTGMMLCFVDDSTMIFGGMDAIRASLDARDGYAQSLLSNSTLMGAMQSVDSSALWSILDSTGTQNMMKQILGEAGSVTDYDSVKKRLQVSWYGMDFTHGITFDLTLVTGDNFTAATISTLLNAAVVYKKTTGDATEKTALADTGITSSGGQLKIHFGASDDDFATLLKSQLFQSMVR